jgi:KaiC/GvpD/RAD55 family RecA-like ATPase
MNTLTNNFLIDLFKQAFYRKDVCEVIVSEVKYSFIPKELNEYKLVLKGIIETYKVLNKLPTIGAISQKYSSNEKVQELLVKIRDSKLGEIKEIISELEIYIKRVRFQLMYDEVAELFEKGQDEKALDLTVKESLEITNFTLIGGKGKFQKVFDGFENRIKQRQEESMQDKVRELIPSGVDPIDDLIEGGWGEGETALWIMRSGVGKSTALKYSGLHAARLGFPVLHIQLEGTEKEAQLKYDQVWTALSYSKLRTGEVEGNLLKKLYRISHEMKAKQRDVSLYAPGQFDEMTMKDIRDLIIEYKKVEGIYPKLLIIDSIDLAHPGDGYKYGVDTQSIKMKIQNSAKKLKNIVSEFEGLRAVVATQTSDIAFEKWNDPEFFITRSNSMGDRNIANSFTYVFTGNQTQDEYEENVMRIYVDKLRHQKVKKKWFYISTAFGNGRFYDRQGTIKRFMS